MKPRPMFVWALFVYTLAAPLVAQDALDDTLALVGLRRTDLGWRPKAWWPRYPDVPYKLRAFDALFAEPLDTVTYARALAETAWDKLDPNRLDLKEGQSDGNLFQALQRLGIDPLFGGFRGYNANLLSPPMPLDEAILRLMTAANRPTHIQTFGMKLPYPRPREDLAQQVKAVPEDISPILGKLVLDVVDAHRWAELAFRKVDGNDRRVVAHRLNVGEEMIDAFDYCPQIDDVARTWDEASLWYAGQKCVQALDDARVALQKALAAQPPKQSPSASEGPKPSPSASEGAKQSPSGSEGQARRRDVPDFAFDWETPWGWIRIRGGGNDEVSGTDALLIVDLGGNDRYRGGVAASTDERPIGLLLDLGGDDTYTSDVPAMGAGLCGVGILMDADGNDAYTAERYAQGVGQFGLGLLADLAGDDRYEVKFSGQGCGYFGSGLLFDVAGNDEYKLWADGQGLGGVHGVGILADRTGKDRYIVERQHSITGRPSYHSPGLDVGVSNAQGVGAGRRGDGADGHSWAGGLGALLDGGGDDYYSSGNWAMGTGYWFGIGILHDRDGDDEYHGVAYTQGTGAHFCIGALIDEAGDDQHLAEENSHSSIAWAHDFTISILLDGAGNDRYRADTGGLSYSINRSISMLIDLGGDDAYQTDFTQRQEKQHGLRPGVAINDERFRARGVSTYFADTTSLALFLDVGGRDEYWGELGNDQHWLDPQDAPNWRDRNFSVGVDRAAGTVGFTPVPVKAPSLGR